jgi:hypothetical protein
VVLGAARIRRKGVDLAFLPLVSTVTRFIYDDAFRLQGYVVVGYGSRSRVDC